MEKHVITGVKLFNIRVCSEGNIDEALAWLRENHRAGTSNNWQITDDKNLAPVTCADDSKRTHYIFVC